MPGKSDGVTFSCYLIADGKQQELMRRHHAKAEWIDYSFDLSPHAGKTVTLPLQVEPGPRNDASFDFSFFGDAKITVGNTAEPRGNIVKEITSTKAYRATADRKPRRTMQYGQPRRDAVEHPSVHRTSLEAAADGWLFRI